MSTTELTATAPTGQAPPDEATPDRGGRVRRAVGALLPAVIFVGIQQFAVLVLSWMAEAKGVPVRDVLKSWDGGFFLAIAEDGYRGVSADVVDAYGRHDATTALAFFPGYPKVVGLVSALGVDVVTAGLVVSAGAGVACAYALARLGELVRGGSRRVGLVLVALFASTPMAITLSMTYSEALFCAFAAWSLVFTLDRQWVSAGVMCACAGLVRTTGAALLAGFGIAVLVAVVTRKDSWRPWVGGLLAPVGLVGFLGYVGWRADRWDGWFELQERGWNSGFDWGAATAEWVLQRVGDGRTVFDFVALLVLAASLILLAVAVGQRLELPLVVYSAVVLVMVYASNGPMASKVRLVVPAFALLLPVAIGLAKRRTSTVLITLTGCAAVGSWFGAYGLTQWGYAI